MSTNESTMQSPLLQPRKSHVTSCGKERTSFNSGDIESRDGDEVQHTLDRDECHDVYHHRL